MTKRAPALLAEDGLRALLDEHWGIRGELTELPAGSMSKAWRVDPVDGPRVVAKLAVNSLEHLVLGLRVSQIVNDAVLPAGIPVAARSGALAVEVDLVDPPHTLAVLEWLPGARPTDPYRFGPAELGALLGRVHRSIAHLEGAGAWTLGDVADHLRGGVFAEQPPWVHDFVADTVTAVEHWAAEVKPRRQLLRGDGPELLVEDGVLTGMIDWGATRWGPVCDDIGCWTVHYGRVYDTYAEFTEPFVEAYAAEAPLTPQELDAVPLFQALRLASRPAYRTDPEALAQARAWIDSWRERS